MTHECNFGGWGEGGGGDLKNVLRRSKMSTIYFTPTRNQFSKFLGYIFENFGGLKVILWTFP